MKNTKCLTVILMLLLTLPGYALVVLTDETIEVSENEVIDDDLIAIGRIVTINGKVNGNAWLLGQSIFVGGEVEGSVLTFSSTANINIKKTATLIAAGGNIQIIGLIEKNVLLFGGSLILGKTTKVGKDLIVYGRELGVSGDIKGTIKGGVSNFVMDGRSGDVDINAEQALIKSPSVISGNLVVRGEQAPVIEKGATITGETRLERKKEKTKPAVAIAPLIAFLISFVKIIMLIAKLITGIIIIALFKNFVHRIMGTLIKAPWKSLGVGFLGFIVIPVAVMILFMILVGFPFAVFGIYLSSILFYLASITVGIVLGEIIIKLFKKDGAISLYLSLVVGTLVLFVLDLVPVLGWIIGIFVLLFGAGALILGTRDLLNEMRRKELI